MRCIDSRQVAIVGARRDQERKGKSSVVKAINAPSAHCGARCVESRGRPSAVYSVLALEVVLCPSELVAPETMFSQNQHDNHTIN